MQNQAKNQPKNKELRMESSTEIKPYAGRVGLVYVRVSGSRQASEGHGRESQEGRCKKELATVGIPFEKSFPDTYTGGGDFMNRPAMRDLLAYVDALPHKRFVVVFDDLKRFARDTIFHLKLRSAFKSRDIIPRCLNYNFDDSPEGMFVETVLAAGNELERHQNRRQVIQKMKARLEAGYWPFSSKKGYTIINDLLHGKFAIPDKKVKEALKIALEGFANGTFVRKIDACRFLVKKGFWKGQVADRHIEKFDAILRDPFYPGYIEYPKWDVVRRLGKHEAIISLDTFERIQKRLSKSAINTQIRKDLTSDFPLRGLLVCAGCGHHLTAAWSKGHAKLYAYYHCQNKTCIYYRESCSRKNVEKDFDSLLKENHLKPGVEKLVAAIFDRVWEEEMSSIRKQKLNADWKVMELQGKTRELTEMAIRAKTETLRTVYEGQLEEMAKQIEQLETEKGIEIDFSIPYRTALKKATGLVKNPYDIWKKLEVGEKHQLYFFLFEEKLAYSRNTGYRTDKTPTATKLFEDFVAENSLSVHPPGIEPGTLSLRGICSTS